MARKTLWQRFKEWMKEDQRYEPPGSSGPPLKPPRPDKPPKPTQPPVHPDSQAAITEMVNCVRAQLGKRYVWATAGPDTFDCSGLVSFCYTRATGKPMTRSSHEQCKLGTPVHLDNIRAGDLVCYGNGAHVGTAVGVDRAVHALNPNRGVIETGIRGANMELPFDGARRIFNATTAPAPAKPPIITNATDFRLIPDLSAERVCELLRGTPMESECRQIAAVPMHTLPLAQSWMESNYGASENARATYNPLGLLWYPESPIQRYLDVPANGVRVKLLMFHSWADAFLEWNRRMTDPQYKGGVYPQRADLEQFIRIYVAGPGPGYGNGESAASVKRYLDATVARLNRYFDNYQPDPSWGVTPDTPRPEPQGGYKAWAVAGSRKWLWLPARLSFKVALTPIGENRSGRRLNWTGVTQHTTNNYNPGMDAERHSSWQDSGTPGNPGIGVHFYIDADSAIQKIPVDERGVHSGDERNDTNVAVELTVNPDQNRRDAQDNAQWLDAGLLNILGATALAELDPHTFNAEGHCPDIDMPWSQWERQTDEKRAALPAA